MNKKRVWSFAFGFPLLLASLAQAAQPSPRIEDLKVLSSHTATRAEQIQAIMKVRQAHEAISFIIRMQKKYRDGSPAYLARLDRAKLGQGLVGPELIGAWLDAERSHPL